jgi:protein TonB
VFGDGDPSRPLPVWIVATAIAMHAAAGGIAWWQDERSMPALSRVERPALQLDRMVEIELPKPKPAPVVEPPAPPKPLEKVKPPPVARKNPVSPPKKAVVRKMPREAQTEPAQAAQVITRNEVSAAPPDAASFDIVTGDSERFPGGVTASSGKSKTAVRQILARYQDVLLAWIERHKRYPRNALRRRIEGRPFLEILLDRSGRLLEYRLTASSHHAELDEAALAMVQRADPFPAVPEDHGEQTFRFQFGVDFNIDGR